MISIVAVALAIDQALPELQTALDSRLAKAEARPIVKVSITTSDDPALIDIAPTALQLFGLEPPAHMDGQPLFTQASLDKLSAGG